MFSHSSTRSVPALSGMNGSYINSRDETNRKCVVTYKSEAVKRNNFEAENHTPWRKNLCQIVVDNMWISKGNLANTT